MEELAVSCSRVADMHVVRFLSGAGVLAILADLLPVVDRPGSHQALPAHEEVRLLLCRFQHQENSHDMK